jgi:hypothetical protein
LVAFGYSCGTPGTPGGKSLCPESPAGPFCAVKVDLDIHFECFGLHFGASRSIFRGRWEWRETWFRVHETPLGGVRGTSESEASRCFGQPSSSRRYFPRFCFVLSAWGALREAPRPFLAHPGHSFWDFVAGYGWLSRPRRGARAPVCVWRCQSGLLGRCHVSFW